jgi:flagellin
MKDLATQAADATSSAKDQSAMQSEYDALGQELSNIMKNTSFGGQSLLDTTSGTLGKGAITFQIGASSAETMSVDVSTQMGTLATSLGTVSSNFTAAATGTELTAAGGANGMIDTINSALDDLGSVRSALGASANRLDHVYNNLSNMSTNTTESQSRIMDVDYASETSTMTSQQMLMQAGTAMLKQSSSMSSMVMSLLQ